MPADGGETPLPGNSLERGLAGLWSRTTESMGVAARVALRQAVKTMLDSRIWELTNMAHNRIPDPAGPADRAARQALRARYQRRAHSHPLAAAIGATSPRTAPSAPTARLVTVPASPLTAAPASGARSSRAAAGRRSAATRAGGLAADGALKRWYGPEYVYPHRGYSRGADPEGG
jgi:hypothetical protein